MHTLKLVQQLKRRKTRTRWQKPTVPSLTSPGSQVMKFTERELKADICANCPARTGRLTTAQLRGSSYRGRKITNSDTPNVDHCFIIVGDITVADVMIANQL